VEISLLHSPPALLNEYYAVNLILKSNDEDITEGTLSWDVTGLSGYCSIFSSRNKGTPVDKVSVGRVPANSEFKQTVYVFSSSPDEKQISLNFSYETPSHRTNTTSSIYFPVQSAFTVRFQILGEDMQQPSNESINSGAPLLLLAELTPLPEYALILANVALVVSCDEAGPVAKLISSTSGKAAVLTRNTRYAVWFHITPIQVGEAISWGELDVSWKRQDDTAAHKEDVPLTNTKIPLPPVRVEHPIFSAVIHVPSIGVIGSVVTHTMQITNHSSILQDFTLLVSARNTSRVARNSQNSSTIRGVSTSAVATSNTNLPLPGSPTGTGMINDAYLISGDRQQTFTVLPQSTYTIYHQLLPIMAGNLPMPYFQVISKRYGKELPQTRNDESFLFVKNSRKGFP